jgi:hypothetical protein
VVGWVTGIELSAPVSTSSHLVIGGYVLGTLNLSAGVLRRLAGISQLLNSLKVSQEGI